MKTDREEVLLRIAAQVGDGLAVDWAEEERAHPDLATTLRQMRLLESLVRSYGGYEGADRSRELTGALNVQAGPTRAGQARSRFLQEYGAPKGAVVVCPLQSLVGGDETDEMVACIREHAEGGASSVVLDLARVGPFNSHVLGAIIACHATLSRRGASLILCNLQDHNRKLLHVTKLDSVLPISDSVTLALSFRSAAAHRRPAGS